MVVVGLQTTHLDVGGSWQVEDLMFAGVDSLSIEFQGCTSLHCAKQAKSLPHLCFTRDQGYEGTCSQPWNVVRNGV